MIYIVDSRDESVYYHQKVYVNTYFIFYSEIKYKL